VVGELILVVSDTGDAVFVTFRDTLQGLDAGGKFCHALTCGCRDACHQRLGALGELLDDCSPMAGRLLSHRGSTAKGLSGWFAGGLVKLVDSVFPGTLCS
jgi:hypothetical protein